MAPKTYKVQQVARLSGVTARTLHHYDAIGLLSPRRTSADHRSYSEADLLRLQQILVHRQLGLPLEKIKALLADPKLDRCQALVEQRAQLQAQADHTLAMIRAIDAALRTLQGEEDMDESKLFEGFNPSEYEAEAKERWGDGDAYRHSATRTRGYSKEDWARIKAESDGLLRRIAELMQSGTAASAAAAMDLAEEHRLQIDRFYYPCSHAMHCNLGQMYTADSRFQENLDQYGDGVAAFLAAAIEANCARAEGMDRQGRRDVNE